MREKEFSGSEKNAVVSRVFWLRKTNLCSEKGATEAIDDDKLKAAATNNALWPFSTIKETRTPKKGFQSKTQDRRLCFRLAIS